MDAIFLAHALVVLQALPVSDIINYVMIMVFFFSRIDYGICFKITIDT